MPFRPSGRECAGTKTRGRYVMRSKWSAQGWPRTFDIEAQEQTVPADGRANVGCGRETRVVMVRANKGMFRKSAECVVCPYCDFGIET